MQHDRAHPLLQQTPLSVNPFIDLPKAPTLPHNYVSIPSKLPPSILNAPPVPSNPDLPAYVTSSSGFSAHPETIASQNRALLDKIETQRKDGKAKIDEWERSIRERELAEKRRKAPGWLDSEDRILEPAKPKVEMGGDSLIDQPVEKAVADAGTLAAAKAKEVDDLGAALDRAFG